jgi:hypothetical protein
MNYCFDAKPGVPYYPDTRLLSHMPAFGITIRHIIASPVGIFALISHISTSVAAEVAGDLLHVYGKIHVSIDNSDTDGLDNDTYQMALAFPATQHAWVLKAGTSR